MLGCAIGAEHALAQGHRRWVRLRASAVSRTTVAPSKRGSVRPSSCRSRSGRSDGNQIDERRRRARRASLFGEGAAVADGSARERHIPMARGGERARVGGHVLGRPSSPSSRPSSRRRPSTGCAAPMCVPGAIAATSAAIVRMKPADAARAPEGATKIATGVARRDHARDDVARGVHEPARRSQA